MQEGPGILLTFDDAYFENWFSALPIFERHGARATFYVCYTHRLNFRMMSLLRFIQMQGHEIGFHSTEHRRAPDVVAEQGLDGYYETEIAPGLAGLEPYGFAPTSFAYPSGAHTPELDDFMLGHFKTVRATTRDPAKAVNARSGNKVLSAAPCDLYGKDGVKLYSLDSVLACLDLARQPDQVIGLYAHDISNTPTNHSHLTGHGLNALLEGAVARGLRFLVAADLV